MADSTATLLDEIRVWLRRFVSLRDEHQERTIALFVLHTYALQTAGVTPYLIVLSPEKQCGKTLLLEVLEELCRYGRISSSMSEAGIYQSINADLAKRPTVLIDEIDAIFGRPNEQTEALRGVINSGNRRSGRVTRGSKDGVAVDYSTFACKILAGIDAGGLPGTVQDRSIAIILQRKTDDVQLERHAAHKLAADYQPLRKRFDGWARENEKTLFAAEPELPDELSDRAKDGWEPLLAIADLAGPEWSAAARAAALALRDDFGDGGESRGVRLLGDLRDALDGREFIGTGDLVEFLNAHEEHPWTRMNRAKGITAYDVALLLRPYRVTPIRKKMNGSAVRGYLAADLADPWARYLPPRTRAGSPSPVTADEKMPF